MISSNGLAPQTVPGSAVGVIFRAGALESIGQFVKSQGAGKVLLVTDPGIKDAGHVERAVRALYKAGITVRVFDQVGENPTTIHVGKGVIACKGYEPELIIGLGGGSAMDCGKGINFLLTNGGRMSDYWGTGKATKPLLPFIAIPTTAGTGSDAQSYALITDPETHQKMACGDPSALPRLAVLDAELTGTQPPKVAAATGIDAVAHAVESAGSTRRNETSRALAKQAWEVLSGAYERAMHSPGDTQAREQMLLGAHLAGAAIENSMLGAAHSLANGLTAICGTVHGVAVGLMLPHVVRFNAAAGENPYSDLKPTAESLAQRIDELLQAGNLPRTLREAEVDEARIPEMAAIAAKQWTATFNPRKVTEADLAEIYRTAR
jgi:alcohol dehydrogenase